MEDLGTDGRNIKLDLKEPLQEGVDWIRLVQDGDTRWAFANTATHLCVPQNVGNFLTSQGNC